MTNKDKYLKDNVSVEEIVNAIYDWYREKIMVLEPERSILIDQSEKLLKFFNAPITPTLTDDERVLLRNIKNDYDTIERTSFGSLKIVKNNEGYTDFYEFNHLFQFIKERRRI